MHGSLNLWCLSIDGNEIDRYNDVDEIIIEIALDGDHNIVVAAE